MKPLSMGACDTRAARRPQAPDVRETAVIDLGHSRHTVTAMPDGDTFSGTLTGVDCETGARWDMAFWLPRAAVLALALHDPRVPAGSLGADAGGHPKRQQEASRDAQPKGAADAPF